MKKILFTGLIGLALASSLQAQTVSQTAQGNFATHVVCDSGCSGGGSGGTSQVDNSTFNLGSDSFTPGGGTYNTVLSALSSGVSAAFRINKYRALWVALRDDSGNEIGVTGNPFFVAQATGANLHMVCDSGCGSPPASADNSAFSFGTTNVSPLAFVVDDVSTNTVTENSFGAPRMSGSRIIYVDLSKTAANATAVKVDGSASPQPVTGTFFQATQPVSGTFFQATQPVSIAATVTTTALTDTQLRASAVPVTANAGTNLNTSALATQATLSTINGKITAVDTGAVVVTTLPAIPTGANTIGAISNTAFTANAGTNLNTSLLSTESTLSSLNGKVTAVNTGAVTISAALPAGTNAIGKLSANSGVIIGDVNLVSAIPAGSALIGQVSPVATATTTNASVPCYITSGASTNATNCKNGSGNIYGFDLLNTTATTYYLRLYNLAAAPTCSSATGFIRTIPIFGSTSGGGISRDIAVGEGYSTGISFCLTGGGSSTDNTNAATGVYVTIQYK